MASKGQKFITYTVEQRTKIIKKYLASDNLRSVAERNNVNYNTLPHG